MSLEDDTKGLITALTAGCLAMLAAGWLFYRDMQLIVARGRFHQRRTARS